MVNFLLENVTDSNGIQIKQNNKGETVFHIIAKQYLEINRSDQYYAICLQLI
jgi:hypothetical protein